MEYSTVAISTRYLLKIGFNSSKTANCASIACEPVTVVRIASQNQDSYTQKTTQHAPPSSPGSIKGSSDTPVLFGSWGIHFMFSQSSTHSRRPSEDSQGQSSVGVCFIGQWLTGNLYYCQMQGSFGITTKAS